MNPNAEWTSLVGSDIPIPTKPSEVARCTWWSKLMRHWQPVVSKWGNGEWLWLIGHGDDLIRFSSVGTAKTWLLKRHRNSIHGISITPTAFTGVWSSTIPPFHLVYQPWRPFEWLLAITGLEQPIIRVIPMSYITEVIPRICSLRGAEHWVGSIHGGMINQPSSLMQRKSTSKAMPIYQVLSPWWIVRPPKNEDLEDIEDKSPILDDEGGGGWFPMISVHHWES